MADSANLINLDQLLEFIKSVTEKQFRERTRGTHGSILADAIRRKYPGFTYESVGLTRLADAVKQAEERGLINRNHDVTHLEVFPSPAADPGSISRGITKSRFLRPEIWRSMIFVNTRQRQFLDRETGKVRSLPADDENMIKSYSASTESIEITRIPPETQRSWLRDYVNNQEDLDAAESPIEDAQWWAKMPDWLKRQGQEFERGWRRERSRRVSEQAIAWANQNAVPETLLFAAAKMDTPTVSQCDKTEDTRRALLAALGDMPLHELENLPIPARYVVRYFRATKIS